jgi:hypothetical protein
MRALQHNHVLLPVRKAALQPLHSPPAATQLIQSYNLHCCARLISASAPESTENS